jgi:PKD repeat protein
MTGTSKILTLISLVHLLLIGCDDQPPPTPDGDMVDAATDGDADVDIDADGDADADVLPDNIAPVAVFESSPPAGAAPLEVTFDAGASHDEDGVIVIHAWDFGDGSEAGDGQVATHRFEAAGCFEVVLTVIDDRGGFDTARATVVVTQGVPEGEPAVSVEGLPLPMAVLPRDLTTNAGAFIVSGTVSSPGYQAVVVAVTREGETISTFRRPLCSRAAADPFEVTAAITAELASSTVEVRLVSEADEVVVASVDDVVAGDVYLVQGQSNAVATMFSGDANTNQGPFLRSFGTRAENPTTSAADNGWHLAEGNNAEGVGAVGQWSLRLGRSLIEGQGIPIAIINGARGGQPITYFQRNDANTTDPATNYGRLLARLRAAGLTRGIRAALYYQGESDGANAEPHHDGMVELIADWREDYPSLERIYVTQVRMGCGGPTPQLRDGQRRLADELEMVSVMSTTGLDGHDGCHFAYENGYELLGQRYAALISRDLYEGEDLPDIDSPNPERVVWSGDGATEVTIHLRDTDSTMSWDEGSGLNFVVEGAPALVLSGRAEGADLVLTLSGDASTATGLTYQGHSGPGPWIRNATGIGLLAFYNLPIEAP